MAGSAAGGSAVLSLGGVALAAGRPSVALVGSRSAPGSAAGFVSGVAGSAVSGGLALWSGGAVGADLLALLALVAGGPALCRAGVVWSAWGPLPASLSRFPAPCRGPLSAFLRFGGAVQVGPWVGLPPAAALARRAVACCSSAGLVVCLLASPVVPAGAVGGSWGSCLAAVRAGVPVVALPCGFPASALPGALAGVAGSWVPCGPGPLAGAFLWVPGAPPPVQLGLF